MTRHAKASSARSTLCGGSSHRGVFATAVTSLVVALALLAIAPSAMASILTRARTVSFGSDGTPASTFGNLGALAFDQASHKLYALDAESPAVLHAFDTPALTPAGGAFPKTLANPSLAAPITVDNSDGASADHIFYVSEGTLYGFDSSGTPLGGNFPVSLPSGGLYFGAAVDSAGNVYVADAAEAAKDIRKYDSAGNFLSTISTASVGGPGGIAFDSNDDLFFIITPVGQSEDPEHRENNEGVWKATAASGYSPASFTRISSNPLRINKSNPNSPHTERSSPPGIAVDAATHTLYVADSHLGPCCAPQERYATAYDTASGTRLYEFAAGIANAEFEDITVDEATGTVYISDLNDSFSHPGTAKVYSFGPAQSYGDATATPTAAKDITDTSAEIGATIADNNVLPTNWRLEYSANGGTTWVAAKSGQTAAKSAIIANTGLSLGTLSVKAVGGTFSLAFSGKTTIPLAYDASAASVQAGLEALSTIGAGNVTVTGGPGSLSGSTPYNITFTGALSGTEVAKIDADATNLIAPPETVSATLSGLNPNSDYKFRVIANKGNSATTEVPSFSLNFKTVAPPPLVSDVDAIQVADTSARLVGTIDPRNTGTGYVYQYGTTPALGSSTAPLDIGSGTTPITVSQVVGGLAKDTTYYYRLVATNLTGSTASASETLHTRTTPLPLPDDRRYEMVTPPDKNLGSADKSVLVSYWNISTDGNSVSFCPYSLFGESPPQMTAYCAPYLSQRAAGGWTTRSPIPPYCRYDLEGSDDSGFAYLFLSADHSHAAFLKPEMQGCATPSLDPSAFTPQVNLYSESLSGPPGYALMSPRKSWDQVSAGGGGSMGISSEPMGGSTDFSHVVYMTHFNQTDPPDSPPANQLSKVYQWLQQGEDGCAAPGGCLTLVSKDTSNVPFETASNYPDIFEGASQPNRAVSTDGERIYFQNPVGSGLGSATSGGCTASCEIYMRENATTTIDISASECTVSCGTASDSADFFKWATPDGEKAFFLSCAKLTNSAAPSVSCGNEYGAGFAQGTEGSKLYRWDESAPPGHRLVDISIDNEPVDGVQPDAEGLLGLIGTSDDGDTVYFATDGQLVSGAPLETDGAKIYRWRWNEGSPTLKYLGAFAHIQGYIDKSEGAKASTMSSRWVSPDGKYLEIETTSRLVPAVDRDSDRDVYRWDEEEGWQCASCQLPGAPSAGASTVIPAFGGTVSNIFLRGQLGGGAIKLAMSDDGRVFFNTPDALVPEDVNGEAGCTSTGDDDEKRYTCQDVYEWNEGTVSLISGGTSSERSVLLGTDPSGRDVFFYTRQRLVGWDKDAGVDIYDARVGGGYPEPPAQPPGCEGESCRGQGTLASNGVGAGTAVFAGPGNPASKHKGGSKHHKKRHHKRQRRANHNRRAGR